VVKMSLHSPSTRDNKVADATMPMCFRFLDTRAVFGGGPQVSKFFTRNRH
jgi:hypothetical protein